MQITLYNYLNYLLANKLFQELINLKKKKLNPILD